MCVCALCVCVCVSCLCVCRCLCMRVLSSHRALCRAPVLFVSQQLYLHVRARLLFTVSSGHSDMCKAWWLAFCPTFLF